MTELVPFDVPGGAPIALLFGAALLLAGRRIFWLVVGVLGFFFAYDLAHRFLDAGSGGLEVIIGILAGIAGIVLAIFLQKVAVGLAGFLVGGYAAIDLLGARPPVVSATEVVAFFVAGLLCAVLALWLFETALILLSSLAGAALIADALALEPSSGLLAFVLLVVVGVAVQTGIGPKGRRRRRRRSDD
jgi:hypothetical protein